MLHPNRSATVRVVDEPLLRNIFELRSLLESYFTSWYVQHHTPRDVEELAAIQREYDRAVERDDASASRELNRLFHSRCYERHFNGEALATYSKYTNLLRALFNRFPNSPTTLRRAGKEHWAIIEAIRAHDEKGAVRATELHTSNTSQYLIMYGPPRHCKDLSSSDDRQFA